MSKENFYITTTIPYVNADPHIGFAMELVQADAIARYYRLLGQNVVFNMGADEHGSKIYKNAVEAGKEPQIYVDEYAKKFESLLKALNISNTLFIRTTSAQHKKSAQEFWRRCLSKGDIYKAKYKIKYCIGCELEKTDSELSDGRCPIHPNLIIEEREEENYFFKFSNYQKPLLELYKNNPDFVKPSFRFNEIRSFVQEGLKDFSVSRLKEKMPWGVAIPDDSDQVMYVWFDALVNYISTLGWPEDDDNFKRFWPGTQIAGKDNLRQQSAIWQAMLISAGLPNSKQILIHGFVTADGQKMSKSLGNVIDPFAVIEKYGVDVVRYYLLREIPSGDDGDFSYAKLEERYNGELANGLGNLVQRVATLIENGLDGELIYNSKLVSQSYLDQEISIQKKYDAAIMDFRLHDALAEIWKLIASANAYVDDQKPWAQIKDKPEEFLVTMTNLVARIHAVAWLISPFMPDTAKKIFVTLEDSGEREILNHSKFRINKGSPLFPRLS